MTTRAPLPFVAQCRIPEPLPGLGAMTLAATARGLALAWFDDQRHRSPAVDAPVDDHHPVLRRAAQAFADYGRSGHLALDRLAATGGGDLPLDPQGTPFQQAVWQVLRQIPAGGVLRYREVAQRIGAPQAVRAVGAAIGRNPIGILVPCHRVIGSDGQLTGYAGGLHRKQALLVHEGVLPDQQPLDGLAA